jgi:hypothetical protein
MIIQSVLFDKYLNNFDFVKSWILTHGFIFNDMEPNFRTQNYYRVRQVNPKRLKRLNYNFRLKLVDSVRMIYFVIAYKN